MAFCKPDQLPEIHERLMKLYGKAERLMMNFSNAVKMEGLNPEIEKVFSECQQYYYGTEQNEISERILESLQKGKQEFDVRVKEWLTVAKYTRKHEGSSGQLFESIVKTERRSDKGSSRSNHSSKLSSSSSKRNEARVRFELAKLELLQIAERHKLEEEERRLEQEQRILEEEVEVERKKWEAEKEKWKRHQETLRREKEKLDIMHKQQAAELEYKTWQEDSHEADLECITLDKTGFTSLSVDGEREGTKVERSTVPKKILEENPRIPRENNYKDPCTSHEKMNWKMYNSKESPLPQNRVKWRAEVSEHGTPENQSHPHKTNDDNEIFQSIDNKPVSDSRNNQHIESLQEIAHALKNEVRMPKPEILKFDGDPMQYWTFINNFEANIARGVQNYKQKMDYLRQFCYGKALVLVKSCETLDPYEGYRKAMNLLYNECGRPYKVSRAFIEKLKSGPSIRENDPDALQQLALLARRCVMTLENINHFGELNNLDNIMSVAHLLPDKMENEWIKKASKILQRTGEEAVFNDLTCFIEDKAFVANTVYSKWGKHKSTVNRYRSSRPKEWSNAVVVEDAQKSNADLGVTISLKCPCCSKPHDMGKCNIFKAKSFKEKVKFLRQRRLCDNCFKYGHIAKFCRIQTACSVEGCKSCHNTLLHPPSLKEVTRNDPGLPAKPEVSSLMLSAQCSSVQENSGVYLCIVPVRVCGGGKEVQTYAFLDQGSTTTLCDHRLVRSLGIKGKTKQFSLTTVNNRSQQYQGMSVDLTVKSLVGEKEIKIPDVLTVGELPISPNVIPKNNDLEKISHLKGLKFPQIESSEVMILIGANVPEVFIPITVRRGKPNQAIAVENLLGWSLLGPSICPSHKNNFHVNYIRSCDELLHKQIECLWKSDFGDTTEGPETPMSREDRYALRLMEESVEFVDGHYQLPLPWRPDAVPLPNNYDVAKRRLELLKRRLCRDDGLRQKYVSTVEDYIAKEYATEDKFDSDNALLNQVWFLPHHPVLHPLKPEKVRVVFDCAAKYRNVSLNDMLMQGPDQNNSLVGVLSRFRMELVAIVADVEAMFHQIRMKPQDCNYLKFLWWPGGNLNAEPKIFKMQRHLFGSTSSPFCANFCLRKCADDFGRYFKPEVAQTVKRNFYVDDLLKSVEGDQRAINLAKQLRDLLRMGGFNLVKWFSNSKAVMDTFPEKEIPKSGLNLDLKGDVLERVLGVHWNVTTDCFGFNIQMKEKPYTRRGILSVVSGLYDPLGFVAPITLPAKLILQDLCRKGLGWDETVEENDAVRWRNWLDELPKLHGVTLPRCVKSSDFGKISKRELHHFADASSTAYGAVSYLRLVDVSSKIHCAFMIGKARLAPIKSVSIPRLELTAAVLAVKLDVLMKKELDFKECNSIFWTDSTAVLQSIYSNTKRFPTFVANRLAKIEENSNPEQWRYVPTNLNVADHGSRGLKVDKLIRTGRWLTGPKFLWLDEKYWPKSPITLPEVPKEFLISKKQDVSVNLVVHDNPLDRLINHYSTWNRLRKAVAWMLRCRKLLHFNKRSKMKSRSRTKTLKKDLSADELKFAELEVIKYVQRQAFPNIIAALSRDEKASSSESKGYRLSNDAKPLRKLNPILFEDVLRVGGRLERAPVDFEVKHPIILPYDHHLTKLLIVQHHQIVGHSGLGHTWTSLRQKYWVIRGGTAVRKILGKCVFCRKRNARVGQQFMADLPIARITSDKPPFSNCGIDFFGPILVKQGRSEVKRYGCIFTCLAMRAVHIEITHSLSTDSFINALRRFIGRRGQPEKIFCDNGTNLVGAYRSLQESLLKLNQSQINSHLRQRDILWEFSPPTGSHYGGCWERLIRSTRKILTALMSEQVVSDETLSTLMVEVESILNSRPLCPVTMDSKNDEPLTPNHLLLLRSSPNLAPGQFVKEDCYVRKRWRQTQYLVEQFWRRWTREYLPILNTRQKWFKERRNFAVNDVVLIVDNSIDRGRWMMGRIIDVAPDKSGRVRQAMVKTKTGVLKRPITKLCLICFSDDGKK